MSFDNVSFTLASALAAAGTVTVGYPSNRSQGNYDWSPGRHVLIAGGNKYVAPDNFTLTFNANASDITLTWGSGMATLPASTACRLMLDRAGPDEIAAPLTPPALPLGVQPVRGNMYLIDLGSPNVADADGICASQSVSSGAAASMNGAVGSTLDVPRNVVGSWTGTAVVTITGKDALGNTVVETSASGTSHTGKKAFKEITSIVPSASITSATFGTGDVLGLPVAVEKVGQVLAEFQDGVLIPPTSGRDKIRMQGIIDATMLSAGTAVEVIAPCAGYISKLQTVVQTAIVTGGAVTVEVATVAVTGLSITVADSATKGTVQSDTPTTPRSSTTVVAAGDRITITPAAAFNGGGALAFTLEIDPIYSLNGTFVPAVIGTAPSGTTGDVFGTYDPADACDGDKGWMLLAVLPNPRGRGPDQYDG